MLHNPQAGEEFHPKNPACSVLPTGSIRGWAVNISRRFFLLPLLFHHAVDNVRLRTGTDAVTGLGRLAVTGELDRTKGCAQDSPVYSPCDHVSYAACL